MMTKLIIHTQQIDYYYIKKQVVSATCLVSWDDKALSISICVARHVVHQRIPAAL